VERRGWVLLALLAAVMVVFGVEAFFAQDSATAVISGSGCCNGHRISEAPAWVYDYSIEQAKYMGTFMVGTGIFALALCLSGLRSARRWAWYVAWYVPVLFAVHGFVLGSFPFDIPTLALGILGLLLMVRPVFGARGPAPVQGTGADDAGSSRRGRRTESARL
jgi:ATP/ADP translocase